MQTQARQASNFMPFTYRDEKGRELFQHVRFIPEDGKRVVYYRWRHHPKDPYWVNGKPTRRTHGFDADDYLYRLPEVLVAVRAGESVWWAEGERDALALRNAGVCGTSHHGAATTVFVEQGAWLADAREVVLCLDKDAPGAADGLLRWQILVEDCGVDPGRIRVLYSPQRGCKDVRDHLEAGHPLSALRTMSLSGLRKEASKYTKETAKRAGYVFVASPKKGRRP